MRNCSGIPWNWNATAQEAADPFPCDRYSAPPYRSLVRALDIGAPPTVVFRWLCQLKLAPYSYDWIDNWGRRSPRDLTPGVEHLEIGQAFLIGGIVEFETDCHITAVTGGHATLIFGHLAISYLVKPVGPDRCRLLVKLNASAVPVWQRVRRLLLAWGDLLMMRKQLLTIRTLSER